MNRDLINKLAEDNDKWINIALSITKDYDEAQDIVQDMYLKFSTDNYDNDKYEKVGDGLVILVMRNIWIDRIRKRETSKTNRIGEGYDVEDKLSSFEFDDENVVYSERFNELPMRQQELILESYDFSVREIADRHNINFMYVQRQIHKGIEYILGDDYDKYNNSNLKYKKV
ncbi:MAG: sigma-70 family RNA polymerase sigma factor [Flavobacteriaceae bacterium]|nr:sigma-70 family RNA polymerase sigma factor [Flavobacteriaceae bacterium]